MLDSIALTTALVFSHGAFSYCVFSYGALSHAAVVGAAERAS